MTDAVASIREDEPVEIVVVDDASPDPETREALASLERAGVRVLRHDDNRGVGITRTAAFEASSAPYVYPLDADDLALPGVLARMADRLDADPGAVACVGRRDRVRRPRLSSARRRRGWTRTASR